MSAAPPSLSVPQVMFVFPGPGLVMESWTVLIIVMRPIVIQVGRYCQIPHPNEDPWINCQTPHPNKDPKINLDFGVTLKSKGPSTHHHHKVILMDNGTYLLP